MQGLKGLVWVLPVKASAGDVGDTGDAVFETLGAGVVFDGVVAGGVVVVVASGVEATVGGLVVVTGEAIIGMS